MAIFKQFHDFNRLDSYRGTSSEVREPVKTQLQSMCSLPWALSSLGPAYLCD